jgi:hypothetical protein
VIKEGQLHPSKPTNPPARSIVSSVPIAEISRTSPKTAIEPLQSLTLDDRSPPLRTLDGPRPSLTVEQPSFAIRSACQTKTSATGCRTEIQLS